MKRNALALLLLLVATGLYFRYSEGGSAVRLYPSFRLDPEDARACRETLVRASIPCWGEAELKVRPKDQGQALLLLANQRLPRPGRGAYGLQPPEQSTAEKCLTEAATALPEVEQAYVKAVFDRPVPSVRIMVKEKPQARVPASQVKAIRFLAETYAPKGQGPGKLDFKMVDTDMTELLESAQTPAQRRREQKELEQSLNEPVVVEVEMDCTERPTVAREIGSPK
ncbi:MAG: hypothetical protein U0931_12480 [Vulcanimicrobiota bacterium]